MANTLYLALRCFECQTFQVNQRTKSGKWKCRMCGESQSIVKVWGRGGRAKDVRGLVIDLSAAAGCGDDPTGVVASQKQRLDPQQGTPTSTPSSTKLPNHHRPRDDDCDYLGQRHTFPPERGEGKEGRFSRPWLQSRQQQSTTTSGELRRRATPDQFVCASRALSGQQQTGLSSEMWSDSTQMRDDRYGATYYSDISSVAHWEDSSQVSGQRDGHMPGVLTWNADKEENHHLLRQHDPEKCFSRSFDHQEQQWRLFEPRPEQPLLSSSDGAVSGGNTRSRWEPFVASSLVENVQTREELDTTVNTDQGDPNFATSLPKIFPSQRRTNNVEPGRGSKKRGPPATTKAQSSQSPARTSNSLAEQRALERAEYNGKCNNYDAVREFRSNLAKNALPSSDEKTTKKARRVEEETQRHCDDRYRSQDAGTRAGLWRGGPQERAGGSRVACDGAEKYYDSGRARLEVMCEGGLTTGSRSGSSARSSSGTTQQAGTRSRWSKFA